MGSGASGSGLNIFAMPKPFRGRIGVIQRNAIRSWKRLTPTPEITLFGDEEGTSGIAKEAGLRHIPDVQRNEYGTPLLDFLFSTAQASGSAPLMCYVNADIMLMSDFMAAVQAIASQNDRFLMVGRRWMVDLNEPWDFQNPDWEGKLKAYVAENGKLDIWSSADYLVFPRGAFREVPPFALGRSLWDNWLIYSARTWKVPVVNATQDVVAVHQNHDYSHCAGGEEYVFRGAEAKRNRELAGPSHLFCIADATFVLKGGRLRPARGFFYLWRRFYTFPVFHRYISPLRWLMDALLWLTRPLRWRFRLRL